MILDIFQFAKSNARVFSKCSNYVNIIITLRYHILNRLQNCWCIIQTYWVFARFRLNNI